MFESLIYYIRSLLKQPFKVGIILLDYTEENSGGSGVSIHASTIARELANWGCDVHVFTRGENRKKFRYIGEGRLVIHQLNPNLKITSDDCVLKRRMSHLVFENLSIQEILKENSRGIFDVIQTHNLATEGAFVSKYFLDIPWVNTFHSIEKIRVSFLEPEEKKYLDLVNWTESTLKYADSLIAVSENLKQGIMDSYGIDKNKIFTIPNGTDLNFFKEEEGARKKNILYIGRFSLEKGIDMIPKIAREVLALDGDITFTVATGAFLPVSSKRDLIEKFNELEKEFSGRFIWHKKILNKEEIRKLYNSSMIYIQPSRYESFGMTVLEAMACGCAVICSNRGGMPELVDNAGIIVPANPKKFVEKIKLLADNYRLRERYSRRAKKRANMFEWGDIALKTLHVYKTTKKKFMDKKNENLNCAYEKT